MAKLDWSKNESARRMAKHGTSRIEGISVAEEAARLLRMHEMAPEKAHRKNRATQGRRGRIAHISTDAAAAAEAARAEYQRMLAEAPQFTSDDIKAAEAEYRRMLDEGRAMRRAKAISGRRADNPSKAAKRQSRQPKFEIVRRKSRNLSSKGRHSSTPEESKLPVLDKTKT